MKKEIYSDSNVSLTFTKAVEKLDGVALLIGDPSWSTPPIAVNCKTYFFKIKSVLRIFLGYFYFSRVEKRRKKKSRNKSRVS